MIVDHMKNKIGVSEVVGLLLMLLFNSGFLMAFEVKSQELDQGWEYRWGDSPKSGESFEWLNGKGDWKSIDFPSNPPGRKGQNNIWYRTVLPEDPELGTSIFINSIDLIAEFYLEDEPIYHYGTFREDGTGEFIGWPWHCITLPRDYAGKTLYVRVFSDYPDIGLWGKVNLGNEGAHIKGIIQGDLPRVGVGLLFFVSGLLLILLGLLRSSWSVILMGALLSSLGFMPIHTAHLKQLVLFAPIGWQYLGAANYFLLPAITAGLIHTFHGVGPFGLHRWTWVVHLGFLLYAMAFPLLGILNLSSTYIHFDILAFFTLLALLLSLGNRARKGDLNDRIMVVGFGLMYLIMVYNGLIAHDLVPYASSSEYLGPAILAICMGIILLRKLVALREGLAQRSQELQELNQSLEKRVEVRTKALEESNQTKDQFFSIIAHDLRGPMGSLSLILEEIGHGDQEIQQELLGAMRRTTTGAFQLLENLLSWARSQKGEMSVFPRHFPLMETMESSLELLTHQIQTKEIEIDWERDKLVMVFADDMMVETIVRNLLGNAVKFTSRQGSIRMVVDEVDDSIRLSVIDDGVGMGPDQVEDAFKYKGHYAMNQKVQKGTAGERGSGLGLSLCKVFVELNGGDIGVESYLGKGSRFWFTLPKGKVTEDPAATYEEEPLEWLQGKQVLIVEDDLLHRESALQTLGSLKVEVAVAGSGEEAVEMAKSKAYDLIFMDIGLPGISGIEAWDIILQMGRKPLGIVLSSFTEEELRLRHGSLKFNAYLNKPLSKGRLLLTIRELMDRQQSQEI